MRYFVDGSVNQRGGRIQVTARLADAQTGTYLWADRLDSTSTDPLAIEDELIGRAVNELEKAVVWARRTGCAQTPAPRRSSGAGAR